MFNGAQIARELLGQDLAVVRPSPRVSRHHLYLEGRDRLVVVVAPGSSKQIADTALAYGIVMANGRVLDLILPRKHVPLSLRRAAWMNQEIHVAELLPGSRGAKPIDTKQTSWRHRANVGTVHIPVDHSERGPDEVSLQAQLEMAPSWMGLVWARREFPIPVVGNARRGRVDLVGTDGQGNIHLVELKVIRGKRACDPLMVLQGLDYWMWARDRRDALVRLLREHDGCAPRDGANVVLRFIVGFAPEARNRELDDAVYRQLAALSRDVPWELNCVRGWSAGHLSFNVKLDRHSLALLLSSDHG